MSQWSTLRSHLSDWRTGTQNRSRELVSLDGQTEFSDHPLPMEELESTIGLQSFGGITEFASRFPIVNYEEAVVPNPVPFVPVMMTWLESGYA